MFERALPLGGRTFDIADIAPLLGHGRLILSRERMVCLAGVVADKVGWICQEALMAILATEVVGQRAIGFDGVGTIG
jgi:hypothetical protein